MEKQERELGSINTSIKNINVGIEEIKDLQLDLMKNNSMEHTSIQKDLSDHNARIEHVEQSVKSLWNANTKVIAGIVTLLIAVIGAIIGVIVK